VAYSTGIPIHSDWDWLLASVPEGMASKSLLLAVGRPQGEPSKYHWKRAPVILGDRCAGHGHIPQYSDSGI
jgi:hypothetical protein